MAIARTRRSVTIDGFKFKESELEYGLKVSLRDNLLSDVMPTNPTPAQRRAHTIAEISYTGTLSRRRPRSFLNPAVNLMLEATLNVVNLGSVRKRMSNIREIGQRAELASKCGILLAAKAIDRDVLIRQFGDDQMRLGVMPEEVSEEEIAQAQLLNDEKVQGYVLSLPGATIADVAIVAGGALRALRAGGVYGNEAQIIGGSPLLAIAGAAVAGDNKKADGLREYLGLPYTDPSRLLVSRTEDPGSTHVVSYTAETLECIQGLYAKGRGCPAQGIQIETSGLTVLEEGWRSIVDYLVPEDATASP